MYRKFVFLFFSLLSINVTIAVAQFYNGHQMDFGKNRVQYNNFYWSFIKNDKYDTYFYQEGEAIARFANEFAYKEILRIEQFLNYELKDKIILVVFNKFSDFRQSNIGLITGKDEYNTGGVTKINRNKISLFYQGNHLEFEKQIKETIAEAIINEMIIGSSLSDNISSSILLSLPEWYVKGLSSFLSEYWSPEIDSKVKDGILNGSFKHINQLSGVDAIVAGHSFWKYLNDYYGKTIIPDILFITRINNNINRSIESVLGISSKEANKQWIDYYKDYFTNENIVFNDSLIGSQNIIKKSKQGSSYYQFKVSPLGDYVAYVSNEMGLYKIWLYNTLTGKTKRIYQDGYKIKQITDYTYPVIDWHPSGNYLTIITEYKNRLQIIQYSLKDKTLSYRNLFSFDKILDFSYSSDASKMVMSAVRNGFTDVFIFDVASSSSEQITNDIADEFNPRFIDNNQRIIFASNQMDDESSKLSAEKSYLDYTDLFVYDFGKANNEFTNLSNTVNISEIMPYEKLPNNYIYLSDKNGIKNLYYGDFDSTISFIDTSIHYRYFLNEKSLTNFSGSIIEHNINRYKKDYLFLTYRDKEYNAELQSNIDFKNINEKKPSLTFYRKNLDESYLGENNNENLIRNSLIDSITIFSAENNNVDIDHYVFEIEKPYFAFKYYDSPIDTSYLQKQTPKVKIYQRTFFTDELVTQVDFGFSNSTYQAFTGGAGKLDQRLIQPEFLWWLRFSASRKRSRKWPKCWTSLIWSGWK